jgi:hypothetical protein
MKLKFSKTESAVVVCLLGVIFYFFYSLVFGSSATNFSDLNGKKINWAQYNYPELEEIKGKNLDFRDLNNFFQDLAKTEGGEYAYHSLAYASEKGFLPGNVDTHLLGHGIGDILYEQMGMEGIKTCTDDLRNACSHSIVVGTFLEKGLDVLPQVVQLCKQAPGGKGAYTMCVHGLGHGVLGYTEYNLRSAAEICGKTGTQEFGFREVGECIGGAIMEMIAGVHDPDAWVLQRDNYLTAEDPLSPCNQDYIPASAKSICYNYLTPHLMQLAGINLGNPDHQLYGKAMAFCEPIPTYMTGDRVACFGGFGKEFTVLANQRNVQNIENMDDTKLLSVYQWCESAKNDDAIGYCTDSALQSLYWGGENDRQVSIRFCSVIPNSRHSDLCVRNLINAVGYYVQDASYKESFCSELAPAYLSDCRKQLVK